MGGNRIIEGGSYLSNTINLRTLGAMPSDATTIVAYQKEVDMALARKAEAERATLSPFDISSPNTFLGSLVHEFATSLVRRMSEGVSGANMTAVVGAAIDLTGDSVNGLFGSAIAEGSEEKFLTLAGDCATVKQAANTEGDLYCNSHNTISTKYMNYTASQWATELAGDLDNGHVIEDSGLEEYAIYGSDREVTVGVKSAAVCEAWKDNNPDLIGDIADVLAGVAGIYGSCQHGIDEERNRTLSEIATGSKYTLSASNADNATMEKYSGYVLYATVASLINESQSSVSRAKEEYYKKHPKDESAAGKIARMSGMTKAEAEVALNYASYLSLVANYNPSERFAFVGFSFGEPSELSFVHDEQVKENLYCYWRGRTEYEDVRNRSFAA